jgi:hypothetical protein
MFFALGEEMLRVGRFGNLAERAAISAWTAETQLGMLCCGLEGIGYALLPVHRLTGSELWLESARSTVHRGGQLEIVPARLALQGYGWSRAVLAEDLNQPQTAAMPLFAPSMFRVTSKAADDITLDDSPCKSTEDERAVEAEPTLPD